MKMRLSNVAASGVAIVFCLACTAGHAQDIGGLGNKLGGMMPGSSMQSGSMGNVAGLLQYCVKNNYLGGASGASGIQSQLLGKMHGQSSTPPTSDPGYTSGANGILQGGNGKTMDLSSVGGGSSDMKSKITTKVCDSVLKQGKSFAGM
ncbi:DUF2501 domain-containing protein [Dyella dinghuensis]|jgi:hypothetical protein|uniref:DUF2501 domain-containing protein n=1 Tax=Dyella dinghuensis TaxID=1920169 RepID=A0A432LNX0_9GAMM|nr:DUF2501 domain-containing protein [Dyella dinghuensis]RUL61538.1 DUF2501 domain-containing protein [Dyella dinghuensis]